MKQKVRKWFYGILAVFSMIMCEVFVIWSFIKCIETAFAGFKVWPDNYFLIMSAWAISGYLELKFVSLSENKSIYESMRTGESWPYNPIQSFLMFIAMIPGLVLAQQGLILAIQFLRNPNEVMTNHLIWMAVSFIIFIILMRISKVPGFLGSDS